MTKTPHIISTKDTFSLNPFTLSFTNEAKSLEKEFKDNYALISLQQQRYALFFGFLIFAILGILDIILFPDRFRELFVFRYGLACGSLISAFSISFLPCARKYMQIIMITIFILSGTAIIGMIIITQSNLKFSYYPSLIIFFGFGYTLIKLRFTRASLAGLIIIIAYEISAIWLSDTQSHIFITYNALIITSNVIGMGAGYSIEYYSRKDYYMTKLLETKQEEINKAYKELEEKNNTLQRLSTIDELTNISNRRKFDEYFKKEWLRLKREKKPISLLLCDIDYFKLYNDYYGHQEGDKCLHAIAKTIEKVARRPADLAARYGGEEFIMVLPDTDGNGAKIVAERILKEIESLQITHKKSNISEHVTISIGIASLIPDIDLSSEILIFAADKALYEAKDSGRNKSVLMDINILSGSGHDPDGLAVS